MHPDAIILEPNLRKIRSRVHVSGRAKAHLPSFHGNLISQGPALGGFSDAPIGSSLADRHLIGHSLCLECVQLGKTQAERQWRLCSS